MLSKIIVIAEISNTYNGFMLFLTFCILYNCSLILFAVKPIASFAIKLSTITLNSMTISAVATSAIIMLITQTNIFSIIVVILLIGVLVFSTIKVIKYIVDNKQNKKIEEEISNFVEYVEETTNNEEQKDNTSNKIKK